MNVDSKTDLPIFPSLHPASKHDSHGFLHNFFRLKSFLPDYVYCKRAHITPFIDLNGKGGVKLPYKNDFTIDKNGCICEHPCSDSKYRRTVHVALKDNPRLFNIPPRDSHEWKLEYNARTSAERSNKREKLDFKLEDGRHRSTKMWYCRLYHILMLQHLNAWDFPFESAPRKLILQAA